MSSALQIEGRVALVTGANRGIGRAVVEALLARGARKVYAAARKPESLAELVAVGGGRGVPLPLDGTDADHVRSAVSSAGGRDPLGNNAGILGHAVGGVGGAPRP